MDYIPFKDEQIKNIRTLQSNILKMAYDGLQKNMSLELFNQALNFVNNELNLPISPRALEIALSSDGYAYANIIKFGLNDTETKSSIANAVAKQYMHRPFPMNLEKGFPGVDEFESRLLDEIIKANKVH